MRARGGQVRPEVFEEGAPGCGPVGRDAARAAEDARVLADRVGGDEPAHARTHDEGVRAPAERAVARVYEGLELAHEELQILVRGYLEVGPADDAF